jgi:hypothetical protein
MGSQFYVDTLAAMQADGTALANSVTATSLLHASGIVSLEEGFYYVGRTLRVRCAGRISNIVTTPGTITFTIRHSAIDVWSSGAIALNVVAKTNVPFTLEVELTCRAVGASTSANLMGIGRLLTESIVGSPLPSVGGAGQLVVPTTAPAVGSGFDSTIANPVNLFAQWSIANAGNTITAHQFTVEAVN